MAVRGKMCQIIVKLLVTLTSATTEASVETHGQEERQITFALLSDNYHLVPDNKTLRFPPDQ